METSTPPNVASRYRARFHFDEGTFVDEIFHASSEGAALLHAEDALNVVRKTFRQDTGYIVADMQKVRYVKVEAQPLSG